MLKIKTHNPLTNEVVERDMTNQELLDYNNAKKADELLRTKIEEEKNSRASAINKIVTAASLTDAEKKALFGE